jgi:hypothetical protein
VISTSEGSVSRPRPLSSATVVSQRLVSGSSARLWRSATPLRLRGLPRPLSSMSVSSSVSASTMARRRPLRSSSGVFFVDRRDLVGLLGRRFRRTSVSPLQTSAGSTSIGRDVLRGSTSAFLRRRRFGGRLGWRSSISSSAGADLEDLLVGLDHLAPAALDHAVAGGRRGECPPRAVSRRRTMTSRGRRWRVSPVMMERTVDRSRVSSSLPTLTPMERSLKISSLAVMPMVWARSTTRSCCIVTPPHRPPRRSRRGPHRRFPEPCPASSGRHRTDARDRRKLVGGLRQDVLDGVDAVALQAFSEAVGERFQLFEGDELVVGDGWRRSGVSTSGSSSSSATPSISRSMVASAEASSSLTASSDLISIRQSSSSGGQAHVLSALADRQRELLGIRR